MVNRVKHVRKDVSVNAVILCVGTNDIAQLHSTA